MGVLSQKTPVDPKKLPQFEQFAREGFQETSSIYELPYDYSILLENLMDPAHVPISYISAVVPLTGNK
jgi:phenylpropionate dioxygenase-like ring-hydroxylating dioxygenase large terminal subunit